MLEGIDGALLAGLGVLALIDSTSIGTLVIPLWLLLAPGRVPVRRLGLYLAVIALFYFLLGVGLSAAARSGLQLAEEVGQSDVARWVQLVVGVGLFAFSFTLDSKKRREAGKPNRVDQWRKRAMNAGSGRALVVLALLAGVIEAVTMLPYLAAMGLMVANDLQTPQTTALLAVYCVVMILPALVLVAARVAAGPRLDGVLTKIDEFLSRNADTALGWVVGIAGFLIARDAAAVLFFAS